MTSLPTVVLVDDSVEVRTLVRARLRTSRMFEVVGEGADGHEAVALAREHRPALMLLDVSMPRMDGLEALAEVRAVSPETRVLMFSGFSEEGLADRARELGATDYLQKSASPEDLISRMHAALGTPGGTRAEPVEEVAPDPNPSVSSEQVLREHLERFEEVFDDAAIGMGTMTLSGRLVRANASLGRLLARSEAELVGETYAALTRAPDEVERALAEIAGGREVVQVEHGVVGSVGEPWMLSTISAVRDARGRPLYLFLQVQDVTAQHGASEALRRSEQRFRLLVEAVQDYAIFMLDPEGHVASWNRGAQRTKGYAAEEIIGQHFRVFYPEEKQAEGHPEHELELAVRDGAYEEEGWRVRKDGSTFWAHVTITAVRDRDGQLVGFSKVTRDTTERRNLALEREQSSAALEEANEQLARAADDQSRFLAVTAHELRTPVSVLSGTADLVRQHWQELSDDERDDLLDGMSSSAERLRRLLNDLITASRIQASALALEPRTVHLDELVAARRTALMRAGHGADIRIDVGPRMRVVADPGRLGQMVDNLLTNGLDHGHGVVTVAARGHGDMIDLEVRDAGPGVPEQMRPRLFERFATSSQGGTGLGLYLVRELARAQGGDASYRPDDNTFVISLPAAGPDEEPAA